MNSMGNLEKLGILVIVILVVVVGVVAITPSGTVNDRLYPETAVVPEPLDGEKTDAALLDGTGVDPKADPTKGVAGGPKDWPLGVQPPVRTSDVAAEGGAAGVNGSGGVAPPVGPVVPPAPVAPEFKEYVVRKGDTSLTIIAKREMGRVSGAQDILHANPGLDPRRMQIGQKIKIPLAKAATPAPAPLPLQPGTSGPTADSGLPRSPVSPTPPDGVLPAPMPPLPPAPAPAPEATAEKTYTVQPGDTLSDIARRELGSAGKWRQIADANTETLHGSESLRPGMKLRIPARTAAPVAKAPETPGAPASVAVGGKTYKVQSGDTLTSIASRMLGASSRWREIQAANEGVLHGSDRLQVGMELSIPNDVAAR